jgi:hypothetical protein
MRVPSSRGACGYDNQTPSQQAQSDEPFFAVSKTVVFEGDARPCKYLLGILKAEAVLGDVRPVLRLIPFRISFHLRPNCIAVCSYKQIVEKIGRKPTPTLNLCNRSLHNSGDTMCEFLKW